MSEGFMRVAEAVQGLGAVFSSTAAQMQSDMKGVITEAQKMQAVLGGGARTNAGANDPNEHGVVTDLTRALATVAGRR